MMFVRSLYTWRESCFMLLQGIVNILSFDHLVLTQHWTVVRFLYRQNLPRRRWRTAFEIMTEVLTLGKWTLA